MGYRKRVVASKVTPVFRASDFDAYEVRINNVGPTTVSVGASQGSQGTAVAVGSFARIDVVPGGSLYATCSSQDTEIEVAAEKVPATSAVTAADIAVTPSGEMTAEVLKDALADLYERSAADAPIDDLRVAYAPTIEEFYGPNTVSDGIGNPAYYWAGTEADGGAISKLGTSSVQLSTGTTGADGTAQIASEALSITGSPVYVQRWRTARGGGAAASDNDTSWLFGTQDVGGTGAGAWIEASIAGDTTTLTVHVHDGSAETSESLGDLATLWPTGFGAFSEFEIACDGNGTYRFYIDGDEDPAATISTNTPSGLTSHFPVASIVKDGTGTTAITMAVDYFAQRVENSR